MRNTSKKMVEHFAYWKSYLSNKKFNVDNDFFVNRWFKFKMCFYFLIVVYLLIENWNVFNSKQCLIKMPSEASKMFREPENCDLCRNVDSIKKISNISPIDFYKNYVKPSRPVVVTDATTDWDALKMFNFEFFKNLHQNYDVNESRKKNCQFFPYKTEFKDLNEVFQMGKDRADLKKGEKSWYVGWSNCNDNAGKILQKYYSKPYFLGNVSENIALSWIFMGGPGDGAQMHVDNVHYPSWQAQLVGRKLWKLAPPPECYFQCKNLEIIIEPGEIYTNRWYHQTFVLPESISITIGSEFN